MKVRGTERPRGDGDGNKREPARRHLHKKGSGKKVVPRSSDFPAWQCLAVAQQNRQTFQRIFVLLTIIDVSVCRLGFDVLIFTERVESLLTHTSLKVLLISTFLGFLCVRL